jgi:hypothetical protein
VRGAGSMGLIIRKLENTGPTFMQKYPNQLFLMISPFGFLSVFHAQ